MRFLPWLILLVLIWLAFRKQQNRAGDRPSQDFFRAAGGAANPESKSAEVMVCCAQCQVYVPQSESVLKAEQRFCCESCCDKYSQTQTQTQSKS